MITPPPPACRDAHPVINVAIITVKLLGSHSKNSNTVFAAINDLCPGSVFLIFLAFCTKIVTLMTCI